ncbi:AAA family ATPase [Streptomyces marincola]|uniref:AAA family ATPase n=1 Tax=Streptomyces marincola TaxID=2878388 RepID=UPI002100454D|nr:LuxR family transcriptional regulator [Streptomyces marincola]
MVLVQREEQFTHVKNAFDNCRGKRRGHVALISGAVGSGKTSLLESLSDRFARDNGHVLRAAGSPSERDIPLGVIGQLLHGADFPERIRRLIEGLLPAYAPAAPHRAGAPAAPKPSLAGRHAPVLHRLFAALGELTRGGPLVLAVDDVQHADSASLHCLLYVIRRLRHEPMLVLMTEAPMLRLPHPHFRAELLSQPHFSRVVLQPLTRDSLTRLVGRGLDPSEARSAAERARALTGGSPLLARALLDDPSARLGDSEGAVPPGGGPFDQAVLGCLYRHEPAVRQVAQALAVLGGDASTDVVAHVLGVAAESVVRATHILRVSGLVEGNAPRHPRITRAVLGDMPADARRRLHARAAELLHRRGAGPAVVAGHLVAADRAEHTWAVVPVLREAAAQALSAGRPEFAGACLRQAWRVESDEDQRADIEARLIMARWQVNPLSAEAHLPELLAAIGQRGASVSGAVSAVISLLWQGRADEAGDVLDRCASADGRDAADTALLTAMRMLLALCRPGPAADALAASGRTRGGARVPVVSPRLEALTVLYEALFPSGERGLVARAEQIIRRHNGEAGAPGLLAGPLLALLWTGRADRVAAWTDTLLGHPSARHAPVWRAIWEAIRGEALLRLGDLRGGERHARSALESITPQAWGVAVAGPLGTLVVCATEAGRLDEAETWLAHPMPDGVFRTPLGAHYLAARGRYHLAAGRAGAAGEDIERCADLMGRWRLHAAGLVPWRIELARVRLESGREAEAAGLLREQLADEGRLDERTRGRALRLLAGTAGHDRVEGLLSEAVDVLQAAGDKVELARALGDLGRALRRAGDSVRPHPLLRRAHQLALEAGAMALANELMWAGPAPGAVPVREVAGRGQEPGDPGREASRVGHGLSEAELRVAALAALGHTNRQISSKLFITVSTVEQHLTRAYRKLGVKRRADLPAELVAHAEEASGAEEAADASEAV